MAGYQDLSEFKRGVTVGARDTGHNISVVAMKFGFSSTTISRVYREYRESGKTSNLRHRCGRKRSYFNARLSTIVPMRTIQRSIIDMGFRSCRPTRVPLLTARHKALHLAWSRHYLHWTVDDWKHVAWSDESRFQLNRADGRERVWRQPHESMDCTSQQGTVQVSGCSMMQDNATPHTSRIATELLQKHSSEFRHFRWLPKSPDMNIIEYIWDALKRTLQKISPPFLTPTDLWTALQDSWWQLPPALLQTLIQFMPRRVAEFLRARGGSTRY
ncbi:transposable element Tcb2 transposase [Trichonephila clavipes]|nr:transposable element Tcb2 transposase [Trichonephila clavipes]